MTKNVCSVCILAIKFVVAFCFILFYVYIFSQSLIFSLKHFLWRPSCFRFKEICLLKMYGLQAKQKNSWNSVSVIKLYLLMFLSFSVVSFYWFSLNKWIPSNHQIFLTAVSKNLKSHFQFSQRSQKSSSYLLKSSYFKD